jgi:hypothetical protein
LIGLFFLLQRGKHRIMPKKSYLWVVLLLVSVILTSCGGKIDEKTIQLMQTFTSTTGITFSYPDDWQARDAGDGIEISNQLQGLEEVERGLWARIAAGTFGLKLGFMTEALDGRSLTEILQDEVDTQADQLAEHGAKTSAVKVLTINGKDGARFDIIGFETGNEAFMILFELDNNRIMMAAGFFHQGELSQYEHTAMKILESITFEAPPTRTPAPTTLPPQVVTAAPAPPTTVPFATAATAE